MQPCIGRLQAQSRGRIDAASTLNAEVPDLMTLWTFASMRRPDVERLS